MITIVGAGPAGTYLGYLLAKEGKKVIILENHGIVGKPVQCTGIVTHSIEKFFKLKKEVIAKRLNKVIVVSKSMKIDVKLDEIVMWRDKFDQFLGDMAQAQGVKILLNHYGWQFVFICFNVGCDYSALFGDYYVLHMAVIRIPQFPSFFFGHCF